MQIKRLGSIRMLTVRRLTTAQAQSMVESIPVPGSIVYDWIHLKQILLGVRELDLTQKSPSILQQGNGLLRRSSIPIQRSFIKRSASAQVRMHGSPLRQYAESISLSPHRKYFVPLPQRAPSPRISNLLMTKKRNDLSPQCARFPQFKAEFCLHLCRGRSPLKFCCQVIILRGMHPIPSYFSASLIKYHPLTNNYM